MKIADVARVWQSAGVSVIPILANQTKRPAFRWSPYQVTIPTLGEVDEWWSNGKPYGLALICGAVSGNLEMTEVEGRACSSDSLTEIANRMDEVGIGHVWDRLNGRDGYSEMSPSGGLHLLYRISDYEVPGNTKIATGEDGLVLAETRGHGGYVIVAPTPGICHPSGDPWDLINGSYGKLPFITWTERNLIHEALQLALGGPPSPPTPAALPAPLTPVQQGLSAVGLTPGDDYEAHTDWAEILEPHGWHLERRFGTERHWTRPGKDTRDGASATTGRASDRDRLYVFSTSTVFQAEVPYTKFGAYALLNHNNDYSAAARELVRLGFGERREVSVPDTLSLSGDIEEETWYPLTELGNAEHLWERVRGRYHWVHEMKCYVRWDGQRWKEDSEGHLSRELIKLTKDMMVHGQATMDVPRCKWASQSQSNAKINGTLSLLKVQEGCTLHVADFDTERGALNVTNGILDLRTKELKPHNPDRLMTRMFGATYNPEAACPEFNSFIGAALPDEEMRTYVQRALGYSMLGDVDQRSIFWIYGPPGTGKSTLMDAIRFIFNDYGTTAPASAFRAKVKDFGGPTNDLHGLQGKRFVTTSETAETTSFDEDLLKRLSGRDQINSRELYQSNQEWTPECVLWMATNNAPRFNSDDDAIWRRTKLIPFLTVFTGDGEVSDFARRVLTPERDGIFNWLLAGLTGYLVYGLGEPESVKEMAKEQRAQSDSVARFMDERILDGILVLEPDERIRTVELYAMYVEWTRQAGERPVGSRRFTTRMLSNFPTMGHMKSNGYHFWVGVKRAPGSGILGSMIPSQPWLDN